MIIIMFLQKIIIIGRVRFAALEKKIVLYQNLSRASRRFFKINS